MTLAEQEYLVTCFVPARGDWIEGALSRGQPSFLLAFVSGTGEKKKNLVKRVAYENGFPRSYPTAIECAITNKVWIEA